MKLAPSILSADFGRLAEQIAQCEASGADWIHVDVMDGHFVPNVTIGPLVVEAARRATQLPLDVHLMIEQPERYLADFAKAGANRLTVHVEACPHLHRTLQQIKELGVNAGVALNPATPASAVSEVLIEVDLVLVMTVNPGFGGQKFIHSTFPKITYLRQQLAAQNPSAVIEVDGGIDANTLPLAAQAGATVFVAGNAVFKSGGTIAEAIAKLKNGWNR
ncbi:MAG: ribulose-phosphate 3-epimerase [Anaerolineales bacterium]|nr:ribulose-phosphate 3-epimerase [Anaerolineales bacterium]